MENMVFLTKIITFEQVCIGLLFISIFNFFLQEERTKSSWVIILLCICEILALGFDITSWKMSLNLTSQNNTIYVIDIVSRMLEGLVFVLAGWFCEVYIEEEQPINKYIFRLPMIITGCSIAYLLYDSYAGNMFIALDNHIENGIKTPMFIRILQSMVIIYYPILGFMKRRTIDVFRMCFFFMFIIISVITILFYPVYALSFESITIITLCILLQNNISNKKEQHKREIEALNIQLQNANTEQLNQLNEIQYLHQRLQEAYNKAELSLSMIESLNKEYFSMFLINKKTYNMQIIRSDGKYRIPNAIKLCNQQNFIEAQELYIQKYVIDEDKERLNNEINIKNILQSLNKEDIYKVNFVRVDEQGIKNHMQMVFANMTDKYKDDYFIFALRNIDNLIYEEKRKRQELENALTMAKEANKAKTAFLNNMSHDIRTPMNAILGFADMLAKNINNTDKIQDCLLKITSSGKYLLAIINDVLDMARIDSGYTTIDEEFVDFYDDQRSSVVDLFVEQAQKKNIAFSYTSDIKHRYVWADLQKIQQIIVNIISNAVKYTPNGGKIAFKVDEVLNDKQGYVNYRFVISDTGIGMSKKFQENIFECFTREKNTTESKILGTGLGMAIVKKLVDLLQGTIVVQSELGKGSTFIVTIPHRIVKDPDKYINVQISNTSCTDTNSFINKHILLAEDNELNAEIACAVLEDMGFTVDVASDGVQCVDKFIKNDNYALILMDIQMPNMNGYEATREIRSLENGKNIPIIAMTANAFDEDKKNALQAGMNSHIAKPIDINVLTQELNKFLSLRG